MTQTLAFDNTTGGSGSYIQSDAEIAGVSLLQTAADITSIVLKITWSAPSNWQDSECYVFDPDYGTHYLFSMGSLPSGSGVRTDTLTIASGSFPSSIDGNWEFYLDDQMGGSNTLTEVIVEVLVTSANMPTTYGETNWYNGEAYQGGIDLSGNGDHAYALNGATIVADTGASGAYAFSFDGTDDIWRDSDTTAYTGNTEMSISCWIKHDGIGGSAKQVFYCNHSYNKGQWQFYRSSTDLGFFLGHYDPVVGSDTSNKLECSNVLPNSGQWYHVAAIFDGSELLADRIKLYVDGVVVSGTASDVNGGFTAIPSGNVVGAKARQAMGGIAEMTVGGSITGVVRYPFDGLVDDARGFPNYKFTSGDLTWLSSARGVAGGPTAFSPFYQIPGSTITGFPNA